MPKPNLTGLTSIFCSLYAVNLKVNVSKIFISEVA